MIPSDRPTVTPEANIAFTSNCFVLLDFENGDGRMDVQKTCVKAMFTTGSESESA